MASYKSDGETECGSRLLILPREIRNHVYQYLHQPKCLYWKVGPEIIHCARIEVEEAPVVSVLLSCSRLRDEYLESSVFRKDITVIVGVTRQYPLSALVRIKAHGDCAITNELHHCDAHTLPTSIIIPLLRRVKHLILRIVTLGARPNDSIIDMDELVDTMKDVVPSLESVRVGIQVTPYFASYLHCRRYQRTSLENLVAQNVEMCGLSSMIFGEVPNDILGCRSVQLSISGRVQLHLIEHKAVESDNFVESYSLVKHHLILFTKTGNLNRSLGWTKEQVIDMFPLPDYETHHKSEDWVTEKWMEKEYGGVSKVVKGWYEVTSEDFAEMLGDS